MTKLKVPAKHIPQFRTFKIDFGTKMIEENSRKDNEINYEEGEEVIEVGNVVDGRTKDVPSLEFRTKGANHLPDISKGLQKRCRQAKCSKKTSTFCTKCNVYLCFVSERNCFKKFHTK